MPECGYCVVSESCLPALASPNATVAPPSCPALWNYGACEERCAVNSSSCSACVNSPRCGMCLDGAEPACIETLPDAVTPAFACADFSATACDAYCGDLSSSGCLPCVANGDCGHCLLDGLCGPIVDSHNATLCDMVPSGRAAFHNDSCPLNCNAFGDCSTCLNRNDECGWCYHGPHDGICHRIGVVVRFNVVHVFRVVMGGSFGWCFHFMCVCVCARACVCVHAAGGPCLPSRLVTTKPSFRVAAGSGA